MQIGTAKYGVRDAQGSLSPERLIELAKVREGVRDQAVAGRQAGQGRRAARRRR